MVVVFPARCSLHLLVFYRRRRVTPGGSRQLHDGVDVLVGATGSNSATIASWINCDRVELSLELSCAACVDAPI